MIAVLNAISHFLVDAVCLATLFGAAANGVEMFTYILIYDTLAISTQCLVGLWTDHTGLSRRLEGPSMLLVAFGYLLPLPVACKVLMIGIGNSFFHVCGGTVTLERGEGKAAPLGVFVAPGAIGVAIGRAWPACGKLLAGALFVCAWIIKWVYEKEKREAGAKPLQERRPSPQPNAKFPMAAVVLLTIAVAVRAVGGSAVSFSWKTGAVQALVLSIFVFAGKTAGGFICDRLGAVRTAWISIPAAAVLTAFAASSMGLSLLGQFLLNLSMPVTLWLLYKLMPDEPGFAFGLAASALWPGTIAGMLITLTGPAQWVCVLLCFAAGLWAVVYAVRTLDESSN